MPQWMTACFGRRSVPLTLDGLPKNSADVKSPDTNMSRGSTRSGDSISQQPVPPCKFSSRQSVMSAGSGSDLSQAHSLPELRYDPSWKSPTMSSWSRHWGTCDIYLNELALHLESLGETPHCVDRSNIIPDGKWIAELLQASELTSDVAQAPPDHFFGKVNKQHGNNPAETKILEKALRASVDNRTKNQSKRRPGELCPLDQVELVALYKPYSTRRGLLDKRKEVLMLANLDAERVASKMRTAQQARLKELHGRNMEALRNCSEPSAAIDMAKAFYATYLDVAAAYIKGHRSVLALQRERLALRQQQKSRMNKGVSKKAGEIQSEDTIILLEEESMFDYESQLVFGEISRRSNVQIEAKFNEQVPRMNAESSVAKNE